MLFRSGQILYEADGGGEERTQCDACKEQHERRSPSAACRGEAVDDGKRSCGTGETRQWDGRYTKQRKVEVERNRDHRAERRASRHAEGVWRGEGVSKQSLKDNTRERQRRTNECGGADARQPREEEDLSVDVAVEWERSVEHSTQTDRGAADRRRQRLRHPEA